MFVTKNLQKPNFHDGKSMRLEFDEIGIRGRLRSW